MSSLARAQEENLSSNKGSFQSLPIKVKVLIEVEFNQFFMKSFDKGDSFPFLW